ncbi:MAG: pyrroloquinoline quinone-dependent dehydrogenase, partial [Gemmatimonadaceae bacterium]
MLFSTPFNRVIALDPETGHQIWRYDPGLDVKQERNEGFVSRGVAFWSDSASNKSTACSRRVLFGTVDARLVALDATGGALCEDFGTKGTVRLDAGIGYVQTGQYGVTSPPVIAGDLVVVGSSMGDNRRVDLESGVVRAYDVRSGKLAWTWDPIPRRADDPAAKSWPDSGAGITGGANAWAPLSVDSKRALIFVPTGSPSTDYYGGHRKGANDYANSVVALEAKSGRVKWHFQVVHHDLWDFDVPAQPTLATIEKDGAPRDVVIVATKMGHLFILDRDSGLPVFPIEERAVPASDVPGEVASATQPFPVLPKPLHPEGRFTANDVWGLEKGDTTFCRAIVAGKRNEGIFTPPSMKGTVMYPGFGGGINWGGVTYDPDRNVIIANTLRLAMWVKLEPRRSPTQGNQRGTPYTMTRAPVVSSKGIPCNPPPWGTLTAIDASTGLERWDIPLGSVPKLSAVPASALWGSPNFGGSIATAGGLTFIAATMDSHLRAFETSTGRELWKKELPAGGQATPMTYIWKGKQYVVIAAGGHSSLGTP